MEWGIGKITGFVSLFLLLAGTAYAQKGFCREIREHRKAYKQEFLKTENAPLDEAGVRKLRFYRPRKTFRVQARLERTPEAEVLQMATYSGTTQPYQSYAIARFELRGAVHELTIYRNINLSRMPMFRTHLFLPFKDATNGAATYGGGRYLDLDIRNVEDGRLEIDFNKAYNPFCAYNENYHCPIPPPENHLSVAIRAGEKDYPGF